MLGIVETKESKDSLPVRHQDMMVDAVDTREPTTVLIKNVEDTSHHLIIESPTVDTASILLPDPPLMPPATRQSFDATAGATGFVVTATRRADGLETAVKFILKDRIPPNGWKRDRGLGGVVPVEVFMLRRLEHPNIVRFLELFEDATFFIVVQESVHAFSGSHQTPVASSATTVSSLASTSSTNSLTSAFIERSIIVTPIREAAVAVLKTHREGTTTEDHHDMDHITSPHIDIPSNPIILLRPPPQPFSISSATVSQSPTTPVHTLPLILQLSHSSHHHHHHPLHLRTTSSSPPSSPPPVVARADRRASNPVSARVVAPKRRKGRRPSQDLFECIERNPRMPEGVARVIFAQIVDAVRFMHAKGYVHRDIKDENVIIDDSLRVKLIDFGTARQIPTSSVDYFDDLCGTLAYSAPEVLAGEKYRGPEADVWSLGVLLFILVESTLPFPPDATDPQCRTIRPVLKSRRSAGCVDLVNRMLDPVAERRITMEEVADHEWIKGIGVGEEEGDKRESDSGVEV
ncbi:kinase-like domain-containing protein [Chytridium lagenaria]|nr:kinase-like domain-containing protein [Chytridium lagenaria]